MSARNRTKLRGGTFPYFPFLELSSTISILDRRSSLRV
jgi:hypothetical protein